MSVAIVVPTNKSALTSDEQISLAHLRHFLGGYDKYLVLPRSGELHLPDFQIKKFDDKFFGSPKANSRLMLSEAFYREFSNYKYILIYQLDCLVFSNSVEPTPVMLSAAKHLPKFINFGMLPGRCKKILRCAQNDSAWLNGG